MGILFFLFFLLFSLCEVELPEADAYGDVSVPGTLGSPRS